MDNLGLMAAVAKKYGSGGNGVGLTEEQVNNIAKIPEIEKYMEQNKTTLDNIAIKIEELEQGGNLAVRDVLDGEIFEIGSDGEEIPPSEMYGEIIISTTSLSVNENSSISFTVALDKAPTNNQVVKINVNNAYCTLDKTSLTFTSSNYNVAQTVAVIGVHDNSSYVNKTTTITVSSSNVSSKTIGLTIVNIDERPAIDTPEFSNLLTNSDTYSTWAGSGAITNVTNNGEADFSGANFIGLTYAYDTAKKYYLKCKVKTSGIYSLRSSSSNIAVSAGSNEWELLSLIVSTGNYYRINPDTSAIGKIKECMLIDLTSIYGSGNEPSLNDCNTIFGDLWKA